MADNPFEIKPPQPKETGSDQDNHHSYGAASSTVSKKASNPQRKAQVFFFLICAIFLTGIYLWDRSRKQPKPQNVSGTFRPSGWEGKTEVKLPDKKSDRIMITPASPLPTPEPVAPHDDSALKEALRKAQAEREEAERRAEEERLKREELERQLQEKKDREARLRSDQFIYSGGSSSSTSSEQSAKNGFYDDGDTNRRFLAGVSSYDVETVQATRNKRIDALVAQGTMIRGILETAIQSDLAGMVRAVVREDVWSFDGRRILISKGSRLIGEYKSGLAQGQTRVFIVWTRMLRSDGVSVSLGSYGTDNLGRSGMSGIVDRHYFERFSGAVMLSMVSGAVQYVSGLGDRDNRYSADGYYYRNSHSQDARDAAAATSASQLNSMANEALKNSINIPPTIHVDQGAEIVVFVRRDLDFSHLYRDPVKEEARRISQGGKPRGNPNLTPLHPVQ